LLFNLIASGQLNEKSIVIRFKLIRGIPLYKDENRVDIRPIGISETILKFVEGLLNKRESENFKNVLNPCQFGRPTAGGLDAFDNNNINLMSSFLHKFLDNSMTNVTTQAPFNITMNANTDTTSKLKRVAKLLACEETKNAMRILSSHGVCSHLNNEQLINLQSKFPVTDDCNQLDTPIIDECPVHTPFTDDEVKSFIKKCRCETGRSLSGHNEDNFKYLIKQSPSTLTDLCWLFNLIAAGQLTEKSIVTRLKIIRGIPIYKDENHLDLRPIGISETIVKIVEGLLNQRESKNFKDFINPCQFGRPTSGGLEALPHAVRLQLQLQPTHIVIENDFKNAFNSIHKKSIMDVVDNHFPHLRRYVRWSYYLYEDESPRIF
jgi:hypothetical protein